MSNHKEFRFDRFLSYFHLCHTDVANFLAADLASPMVLAFRRGSQEFQQLAMLEVARQRRDTGFRKLSSAPLVLLSYGWRNSANVPPFTAFQELRAAWRTTISFSVGSLALSIKSSVRTWSALLTPSIDLARSFKRIWAWSLPKGCSPSWFTLAV